MSVCSFSPTLWFPHQSSSAACPPASNRIPTDTLCVISVCRHVDKSALQLPPVCGLSILRNEKQLLASAQAGFIITHWYCIPVLSTEVVHTGYGTRVLHKNSSSVLLVELMCLVMPGASLLWLLSDAVDVRKDTVLCPSLPTLKLHFW